MANDLKYHSIYSVERTRQQHFTHSIFKFCKDSSPMFHVYFLVKFHVFSHFHIQFEFEFNFKLLKLSELFELRLLTFVFDSVNKSSPTCFHDFFLLNSSVHQYSTRQASQGDLYMFRKNSLQYGLKSIRYLGARLWNALSVELRNASSKILFKTKLKSYLLSKVDR